jgi:DNA polymerase-3 subunit epsilon
MTARPWHQETLAVFDVESTGTSVDFDRVVTATIATITPGQEPVVESWLINPLLPIPAASTAIHGITDGQAQAEGEFPAVAIKAIADSLGRAAGAGIPVIAFNACFDFTILDRECRRHGVPNPTPLVIDPIILDKQFDKWRKGSRTLSATCEHYRVALNGAHDATQDALAAGRIAWRMAELWPKELQIPLVDLHTKQAMWRHAWAAEFQTYLRRTDPQALVNGEWPVQSLPEGWAPDTLPLAPAGAAA